MRGMAVICGGAGAGGQGGGTVYSGRGADGWI